MTRRREQGLRAASGHRLGAWHQNARLTDAEVVRLRFLATSARALDLQKVGRAGFGGYMWLGRVFDCGPSTARDIVNYRTRSDA